MWLLNFNEFKVKNRWELQYLLNTHSFLFSLNSWLRGLHGLPKIVFTLRKFIFMTAESSATCIEEILSQFLFYAWVS